MHQDAAFFRDPADLADILDHADFVVGVHHADQDGLVRDRRAEFFEIDQAVALDRQISHADARFFQTLEVSRMALCSVAAVMI